MRSFRLKLERRRQTSVHLGFGLSKGGLDAVICGGSGANVPRAIQRERSSQRKLWAWESSEQRVLVLKVGCRCWCDVSSRWRQGKPKGEPRRCRVEGYGGFPGHGRQARVSQKGTELVRRFSLTVVAYGLGSAARLTINPTEGVLGATCGSLKQAAMRSALARRRMGVGFIAR